MDTDAVETVNITSNEVMFYAVTPSFTNVDIRITIDVVVGNVEVFITNKDNLFMLSVNNSVNTFSIDTDIQSSGASRKRRSPTTYIPAVHASKERITTFTYYNNDVFLVTDIQRRAIITIKHKDHDLRKNWFYVAIRTINKTKNPTLSPAKALVYFRQDLPRIDLVLFFLVLSVILMFILCAFLIVMKVRMELLRRDEIGRIETELEAMKNRPLASYSLLFEPNKNLNVIRKRKNRTLKSENKRKHATDQQTAENPNNKQYIEPVTVQDTEDNLAAVVTVFVQYPDNEISSWNFSLGSGICQLNNQQVLQVRTISHGSQGRRINTRISATLA